MNRQLFKEAFKAGYKKAKLITEKVDNDVVQDVLSHTELDWKFDDETKYFLSYRMFQTKFELPCSSYLLKSIIDKYFDEMSNEKLEEVSKKFKLDIIKRHTELEEANKAWTYPTVIFEVSKDSAYDAYTNFVKKLVRTLCQFEPRYLWPIEILNEDNLKFAVEQGAADRIVEYTKSHLMDEPCFEDMADLLDIWGEQLKDDSYLIKIALHLAYAKMTGVNIYNCHQRDLEEAARFYGRTLEDYLTKNLSLTINSGMMR